MSIPRFYPYSGYSAGGGCTLGYSRVCIGACARSGVLSRERETCISALWHTRTYTHTHARTHIDLHLCRSPSVMRHIGASADVTFVCVLQCVRACVHVSVCARLGVCAHERAHAHECAFIRAFVCACVRGFCRQAFPGVCGFDGCVCLCGTCECGPRRCAGTSVARRRLIAVCIARLVPCGRPRGVLSLRVEPSAGFARRCHLETRDRQRAVGCAIWAHVRDRRRRRHLRHRRQRQRHPLPRRVGEHRRRCATRTNRGWSGVVLGGHWVST